MHGVLGVETQGHCNLYLTKSYSKESDLEKWTKSQKKC